MIILFDIGGTKCRFAVSGNGNNITDLTVIHTPLTFEDGFTQLVQFIKEHTGSESKISGISGGFPGVFDKDGKILKAPNLQAWIGKSLKSELQIAYPNIPVYVRNDAEMAALGEANHGAGKNYRIVVYITVSTGVGGARIVDKKIDINSQGFEPGHQIIDADGSIFPESTEFMVGGSIGYLENYISGKHLTKRYGKYPEDINNDFVWNQVERYLAVGLNNVIVHWSPNVVVLGGGLIRSGKINVESVKKTLSFFLKIFPQVPDIKVAELGESSGLRGALTLFTQGDEN